MFGGHDQMCNLIVHWVGVLDVNILSNYFYQVTSNFRYFSFMHLTYINLQFAI
jgi:hypothetical protein